ncbi:hypothetical protein H2199_003483 [Coniosporium tulheliwenetii]|uniref:Uncharacterized protein n=1 Tax=Coniosporium tulheliwenetii TaxID=3383036 RepID=A0ACC2ZA29_9PEZI|nr:hypothetical protein H2199_003483 [Cladosporium sp. JES 115]
MCGIFFSLGRDAYRSPSEHVLKLLRNRGPDSVKEVRVEIEVLDPALDGSISEPLYATFVSSVLALRGEYIVTQPLVDEATRSVLCWNGEAWKIDDNPVTGNDSEHVFSLLLQDCEAGFDQDMVVQSMMHIKGPYAFVFYDGRRRRLAHDGPQVYDLCPDRITAKASHSELQTVCPGRNWRLVEINVPFKETQAHRDTVIRLMHPHNTEMDLSIAYALYFACRGIGVTDDAATTCIHDYATPARVLLSGLGADELFGGYQRHATAFARRGYQGLVDELELDINRLGKRNLGRDDRVLSHWGRETRFPYLDEDLLKWALAAPVWEKCGFDQDLSDAMEDEAAALEPGKKALRLLAWKLGMRGVAKEKKRAIQFGARTAKMEGGKMKGTQLIE